LSDCLLVLFHEFGHKFLSKLVIKEIQEVIGPEVFGTEVEVGSLAFRPWTGVFLMKDFVIKNPPGHGYKGKYLLKAAEVSVLTAPKKILFSMGRKFDIRLLRLQHIDVEVEFSGYLFHSSNLAVVRQNVANSYQSFLDLEAEQKKQGKQPGFLTKFAERRFHDMLDHIELHQAEFVDICATAHHALLGGRLSISDIEFADFSKENNAIGVRAISSHLTDAFYKALQEEALGETGAAVANIAESSPVGSSSLPLGGAFDPFGMQGA